MDYVVQRRRHRRHNRFLHFSGASRQCRFLRLALVGIFNRVAFSGTEDGDVSHCLPYDRFLHRDLHDSSGHHLNYQVINLTKRPLSSQRQDRVSSPTPAFKSRPFRRTANGVRGAVRDNVRRAVPLLILRGGRRVIAPGTNVICGRNSVIFHVQLLPLDRDLVGNFKVYSVRQRRFHRSTNLCGLATYLFDHFCV